MSTDVTEHTLYAVAAMPKQEVRNWISALAAYIMDMPEAIAVDTVPVKHTFAPGLYAREMFIPKGLLIIGKLHKHAHMNTLSKGTVVVLTEAGVQRIAAPYTFVSEVGARRVVYAMEDTIWTTYHVTDKTDLAEVEAEVIAKDYGELELEQV